MQIKIIRISFVIIGGIIGYLFNSSLTYVVIGIGVAGIFVGFETLLRKPKSRRIVASILGLAFGSLISHGLFQLLYQTDSTLDQSNQWLNSTLHIILILGGGYTGMICGYYLSESLPIVRLFNSFRFTQMGTPFATNDSNGFKLLDTSVIIDGRILEICETQFIDGTLLIPRFVLNELQHIADSNDLLRRNKGRRGFDILRSLQNSPSIAVENIEEDVPHLDEVDAKLVHLAKKHYAKIITNDLNLNKVAELQGVTVLNINELANAIRPIVIAGEIIQVHLQKIGKEPNQGVGYLDDGTMVIVEDGKSFIGQTLDVVVTQMLRTSTGQMIFARNADEPFPQKGIR